MTKYHHGDLRNSLVEAAVDIIKKNGIERLSIRATAKKIGVSHTAPYRHFKNKEELIVAVALKGFDKLGKKIDPIFDKHPQNISDMVFNAGKAFIYFAMENSNYYRIMFGNSIINKTEYPDFFKAYDSIFIRFTWMIHRYKKINEDKVSFDEASIITISYFSLLHGYSSLVIDNKEDEKVGKEVQINSVLKRFVKTLN